MIANRDERTTLLGNQGGGSFSDLSLNMPEDWDRSRDVHFIDIDGDGDLDLYLINDDQDRIYENQLVP